MSDLAALAGIVRVEKIGAATLYLGDSRALIETVTRSARVISDPPYGIGYVHGGGGRGFQRHRLSGKPIVGDGEPFDPRPLLVFNEVLIWGADHFYPRLPDRGRFLAWDKLAGASLRDSFADVELAWHSREAPARIFSHLWKGVLQDSEKDARRVHPTQKPVELMGWCIAQTATAGPVFDPFMGSGSTGVAAMRAGLPFIGAEIDPAYFDHACARVHEAWRAPRLIDAPPKAVQNDLFSK